MKVRQWLRIAENKALDFCVKHRLIIFAVIATILAMIIRYKFLSYESGDYRDFLLPWFNTLKEGGGLPAVANFSGDYNMPYVTLLALLTYLPFSPLISIKLLSILFDVVLALSASYLVYSLKEDKTEKKKYYVLLVYVLVLFLPQVLMNGAMWAQCDSIYASFCILAITLLLKEKYSLSFVFLGLAFAFKLQFIFIVPIFLIIYAIKREFSILNFLIIPAINLFLCLPAICMGRSIIDCFLVYFQQTQTYSFALSLNFINLYQIIGGDARFWNVAGVIITLIICGLALLMVIETKMELTKERILALTVWFCIAMTFFLPGMHERYLYVGEILAIIYYIVYRKNGFVALLINVYSWITYAYYFAPNLDFNYHILAVVELFVLAWFTKNLFYSKVNNNFLDSKSSK